jgi:glyoxylase-like metal-dependent hydrolase (beta-lactamase superfamily II)
MCEVHRVRKVGRRTWLTRSASGLLALWAGLDFGLGRRGWGVLLGGAPRNVALAQDEGAAAAQPGGGRILPVEVTFEAEGQVFPVAAYVVVRGGEVAVVDTLTPGNADRIGGVVRAAGLGWDAVRHVIITHYHPDHAGSVADVSGLAPEATVWAGAPDIPQIPLERGIRPAADGAEVFGLRIVATPGHTAGHISVLDPTASTLVVGDAAFNLGGQLLGVIPQFTADADQARESIRKLGTLGFERALFGHGPPIERGASGALATLVGPAPAAPAPTQPAPAQPAPAAAPAPAPVQIPRAR